jgi:hypothetical protein
MLERFGQCFSTWVLLNVRYACSIHHSLFTISCAPFSQLPAHRFGAWVFDLDANLERRLGVGDGAVAVAELVEGQTHVEESVPFALPVTDFAWDGDV